MQMERTESGSFEGFCSFADQTEHRVLGTIRGEYMEHECGMAAQASQVRMVAIVSGLSSKLMRWFLICYFPLFPVLSVRASSFLSFCYA